MNGLWCYEISKWSSQYCDSLITRIGVNDLFDGKIDDGRIDNSIRRSKIKFISVADSNFKDIFDNLWLMALEANKSFFNFHISKLDYVQLTRYDAENRGEYTLHQDIFWLNNDPAYHRKLSCSIQLSDSDDYEGGDLIFDQIPTEQPKKEDLRIKGTVIFFPSFVHHAVTPITKGTRYSLVAWFDGPKWR